MSIRIDGSGRIWSGNTNSGLVRFDGANWTIYNTSNSGLPQNQVRAISFDDNGNKWIGTNGGGVAMFDDNDWTVFRTFNSDLPSDYIRDIYIDSNDNKWIATHGGGLAIYKEDGATSVDDNINNLPEGFYLSQNYPNPFNPNTIIKFAVPLVETHRDVSPLVTLKVYDVLGNEVATLVNEYKPAGEYQIDFNAANLTSGTYIYRLVSGGFSQTGKMILLR
jgi:hypothetical protein